MTHAVDVLTFGEAMLVLRASGPLAVGAALTASMAGAEANVAVGLTRLGHRVAWAGRVGGDEAGAFIGRTLRGEGVDVRDIVDDAPTGILLRRERLPGVTRVNYHRRHSAGAALTADDVVPHLDGAVAPRWLHVSGVTAALSNGARRAVAEAIEAAHVGGARVCLDVNHRSRLWSAPEATAALAPLARAADVVVASDDELPLVADTVDGLLRAGVGMVVVKHGAAGAVAYPRDGEPVDRPAVPVRAVDAVGAGDAFCAGLLSGLLDGLDPAACLDRAVQLGAFAVATSGDWEGLPTRAELGLLAAAEGAVLR